MRSRRSKWHWLLWIFVALPLAAFWYDRSEPRLFGIPFFYWAQMSLILIVWFAVLAVHLLARRARR
jgi:hypothetical protein